MILTSLRNLLESKEGKILMSVLLGFGLATFFRQVCKGRNCIIYNAPPLDQIQGQTYKHEDKCYQYKLSPAKCDKSKQIVRFA